jgi:tetraacyldisaccharide 4'-kinase
MRLSDPVLYPFSFLYDRITRFRNRMFDLGMKKSILFDVPTIVVGNLSWGGTGKTPMVEYLIRQLKGQYQIATLSRGYGRKTSGFLLADEGLSSRDIGDEPFQIYSKFGKEVTVAVGEERILAIPQILAEREDTELILLDDAFQHRYVKADVNILLTTYQQPFFKDRVLPLGTLREHPTGANRADVIVVTKCPDGLDTPTKEHYIHKIREYAKADTPVIFAGLKYGEAYPIFTGKPLGEDSQAILLSGIANNEVLKVEVKSKYALLEVLEFPDHHKYSDKDLQHLFSLYQKHADKKPVVITTEKDAVKLKENKSLHYLTEIPIFALPVEIKLNPTDEDALLSLMAKIIREKALRSEN